MTLIFFYQQMLIVSLLVFVSRGTQSATFSFFPYFLRTPSILYLLQSNNGKADFAKYMIFNSF